MRDRAVVAFEEVVDDVLPVGLDLIGQAVGEFQRRHIRAIALDVVGEVTGLGVERRRIGIQIDEHEAGIFLEANLLQREFLRREALHAFLAHGRAQAAVGVV
ncbi:MAG: hypothetical protein ACK56I_12930, partial [bacterium]